MRAHHPVFVVFLLVLSGCGGSSSKQLTPVPTPPSTGNYGEPAEGAWHGTITSAVSGESADVFALVDGWGYMELLTEQGNYSGAIYREDISHDFATITADLTGISAVGATWLSGATIEGFSLTGTMEGGAFISADYAGGGDAGTVSLSFDRASLRGARMERAQGTWVRRDASQNITATFEITVLDSAYATLSGSDVDGCVYGGNLEGDWWTSAYVFDVALYVGNCPLVGGIDVNGNYGGAGGVTDIVAGSEQDDRLILGVNNGAIAIMAVLEKL